MKNMLMIRISYLANVFIVLVCATTRLDADDASITSLRIIPERVDLRGSRSEQRLIVQGKRTDGRFVDLTAESTWTVPPIALLEVAEVVDGTKRPILVPREDGAGELVAHWQDLKVAIPVRVEEAATTLAPRIEHDVIAHLTRATCNSGACHGSQHGRGDLKLSLLGYEVADDYAALTKPKGRPLLNLTTPDASRLLRKPLGQVQHEGEIRIVENSRAHHAIRDWIGAGAPGPVDGAAKLVRLEGSPAEITLEPEGNALLLATAVFDDERREDVTDRALLSSLDDGIATVSPEGEIVARRRGETAIMMRYQGTSTVIRVVVPYRTEVEFSEFEPRGRIDELAAKKWRQLGLAPSAPATDGEFIRRVFVAAMGTLPTPVEVAAFLDDDSPDKRGRLVDEVLRRPEYVDYWTLKWGDLLRINRKKMNEKGMWSLTNWVRSAIRENRPLDRLVSELVTAQGSTYTSGPTNYFRVAQKPQELAETTAQVFLGTRLECAQCHHHPFEKWSQTDYWGLAAYFARLGIKSSSEFGVYGREQVVYVKPSGEVKHPRTKKVVPPRPLDAPAADDPVDRRRALARWLTSKDNQLFAKNIANRVWSYLMGRGIVEPVDDLRVTNPPSNPALLDALATVLIESGYDQKQLIRTILRSRVFELSARSSEFNREDERLFSRYPVQRLPAEVLHDAISAVTAVPESFSGLPAGSRAIQLPDAEFESYFLASFGKPKRLLACECERVSKPNLSQALHLAIGDTIGKRLSDGKGRVATTAGSERPLESVIDEYYLAAFARRPSDEERDRASQHVALAPNRREGLEDLLWALLNSTEFLFNH